MNTLFKSILLSQCLVLGISAAYAGNPGKKNNDEGPVARPTARISLTMPHQCTKQDQTRAYVFKILMTGSISGTESFEVSYQDYAVTVRPKSATTARNKSRRIFCDDTYPGAWTPLNPKQKWQLSVSDFEYETGKELSASDGEENLYAWGKEHCLDKYLLIPNFDLSAFQGKIAVAVERLDQIASAAPDNLTRTTEEQVAPSQEPIQLQVQYAQPTAFNSNTESVWIMLNDNFTQASVLVHRCQNIRSLYDLVFTRIQQNIANNPDEQYSRASIGKVLPRDLVQLIPRQIWKKREEKSKGQAHSNEAA